MGGDNRDPKKPAPRAPSMTDQATPTTANGTEVAGLQARLEKLEQALAASGSEGGNRIIQANLDAAVKQLNDLRTTVDQIARHLSHSAGYRLRDTFECDKCRSRGHAAVRICCTVCNRESWLGWFPKETSG